MEESPHKCPVCARSFNQRSNLKTHLLTHTDHKPFECNYCRKVFRRNCDLRRHTLTHTVGDVSPELYEETLSNNLPSEHPHAQSTASKPKPPKVCGNALENLQKQFLIDDSNAGDEFPPSSSSYPYATTSSDSSSKNPPAIPPESSVEPRLQDLKQKPQTDVPTVNYDMGPITNLVLNSYRRKGLSFKPLGLVAPSVMKKEYSGEVKQEETSSSKGDPESTRLHKEPAVQQQQPQPKPASAKHGFTIADIMRRWNIVQFIDYFYIISNFYMIFIFWLFGEKIYGNLNLLNI